MTKSVRIRCETVPYRSGFLEVMSKIHPGLVNLELWQVNSEADISGMDIDGTNWNEEDVVANVEFELTPAEVVRLIEALSSAVRDLETE